MKIGYPCINTSLPTSSSTFRLSSYSPERFVTTVEKNLRNLESILKWNVDKNLLFFRISSDIVPFASHPICTYKWQKKFKNDFKELGDYIKRTNLRISMHPDQFVLLNSISEDIFKRSVDELMYHAAVLNLMELDVSHKLQIHVGGVYGEKEKSIDRFITRYTMLPTTITSRLVIENDDRLYTLQDCLYISKKTGVPILFDTFHHEIKNNGEAMSEALHHAFSTWKDVDGDPMIDYSNQEPNARIGNHARTIDIDRFESFLNTNKGKNFDIMLEIKDKENSALKALSTLQLNTINAK